MNDTDSSSPEVSLDSWAIIELFGHSRVVGKCSNVSIAGCGFIRVQVPAHDGLPAYTRDIAPKAVYAINPCDEAAALTAIGYASASPVMLLCRSDVYQAIKAEMQPREAPPTLPEAHSRHDAEDDDQEDGEGTHFWKP